MDTLRDSETSHHWCLVKAERDSICPFSWQGHASMSHVRATCDTRGQCAGAPQKPSTAETSHSHLLPSLLMLLPSWRALFLPSHAHPELPSRSSTSPRDHAGSSLGLDLGQIVVSATKPSTRASAMLSGFLIHACAFSHQFTDAKRLCCILQAGQYPVGI